MRSLETGSIDEVDVWAGKGMETQVGTERHIVRGERASRSGRAARGELER